LDILPQYLNANDPVIQTRFLPCMRDVKSVLKVFALQYKNISTKWFRRNLCWISKSIYLTRF